MKATIDYSKSPAKAFDAVEDIKSYFGDRWDIISPEMAKIKDIDEFMTVANFAGIRGYPVRAWYDLYNGEGAFAKAFRL